MQLQGTGVWNPFSHSYIIQRSAIAFLSEIWV